MSEHVQRSHEADQTSKAGDDGEYEVLLVTDPEHPGYSVLCPELGCASQGDTRDEAVEMIAEAIALYLDGFACDGQEAPHDPDALARAVAEYEAEGTPVETATVRPEDWDAIIARCDVAIAQDPNDVRSFLERAGAFLDKRENERALDDYNTVISMDPELAEAYRGRADAHLNSGRFEQAIADYDAALRRNPYDYAVLTSMEHAYVSLWETG